MTNGQTANFGAACRGKGHALVQGKVRLPPELSGPILKCPCFFCLARPGMCPPARSFSVDLGLRLRQKASAT